MFAVWILCVTYKEYINVYNLWNSKLKYIHCLTVKNIAWESMLFQEGAKHLFGIISRTQRMEWTPKKRKVPDLYDHHPTSKISQTFTYVRVCQV